MIRATVLSIVLSFSGCVALPDTAKGKARANREYWVVSHTIQF